jgi:hypothetical protein
MVMASTEKPSQGFLRPRNRSVPSYRPTQRSGYTGPVHQCVPGSGEIQGAAHVNHVRPAPYGTEQKRASNQPGGIGDKSLYARVRSMTQGLQASRALCPD